MSQHLPGRRRSAVRSARADVHDLGTNRIAGDVRRIRVCSSGDRGQPESGGVRVRDKGSVARRVGLEYGGERSGGDINRTTVG